MGGNITRYLPLPQTSKKRSMVFLAKSVFVPDLVNQSICFCRDNEQLRVGSIKEQHTENRVLFCFFI